MSSTMVQIRSVPQSLHRRLKARAALEGVSMSSYLLREIRKSLDRPMRQEILERLQERPVRQLKRRASEVIRAERDRR
jgi:plasmid stability protein